MDQGEEGKEGKYQEGGRKENIKVQERKGSQNVIVDDNTAPRVMDKM